MKIEWNPEDPGMRAVRDKLAAGNPRGEGNGLQWFISGELTYLYPGTKTSQRGVFSSILRRQTVRAFSAFRFILDFFISKTRAPAALRGV
jgi:hypothetical protein